jgi:anti-sigma regulatory factor (Ser/Thr protein kinase)
MKQLSHWSHETEFDADAASASTAREFVSRHLVDHGLVGLVEDVRLVTSELATNAMRHAGTPFRLTLQRDDNCVLLTVRDGSPALPAPVVAQDEDDGGRGLRIVDVLSWDWGVTSANGVAKSVWARFDPCPVETSQRAG